MEELQDTLYVESLRGRLKDIYGMDAYFRAIEPGKFSVIVLDAFYRFLPRDSDENSNADLAAIYNQVDRYAERLKCCFVCIHHSSKGIQSGKSVTDVGSGGGAQSRAADAHLILRHHEQPDTVVLEAAVRSWKPVEPVCLRWSFPVWTPASDLNPEDLRQENRRKRKAEEETPEPAIVWNAELFAKTFITDRATDQAVIMARAGAAIGSGRKAKDLLTLAVADGLVHRWTPLRRTQPLRYATVEQPITDTGGRL